MNWKQKKDRLAPEINKGVNFLNTGALLLLFTLVANLLKATVFFAVAIIIIKIEELQKQRILQQENK